MIEKVFAFVAVLGTYIIMYTYKHARSDKIKKEFIGTS